MNGSATQSAQPERHRRAGSHADKEGDRRDRREGRDEGRHFGSQPWRNEPRRLIARADAQYDRECLPARICQWPGARDVGGVPG